MTPPILKRTMTDTTLTDDNVSFKSVLNSPAPAGSAKPSDPPVPPGVTFVRSGEEDRKSLFARTRLMSFPPLSPSPFKKKNNVNNHVEEDEEEEEEPPAITLRNAFKHYGRGAKKVPILVGLDMTIPRGAIYGLLGPSGCGKTTLLQCIVGKKGLKSGEVVVFGGAPGSAEAGVPGARVGYMPQELALYGEFTLTETLQYFGRIFNMSREKVAERTEFLLKFLDLPRGKRLIMNFSGGQQRRASLAAALLHEPELLILDEPTVGVDPLLRQCIWSHLLEISKSGTLKTTIVVTTHYIEEARQANVIGMMRFGKLLAEGPPDDLLKRYDKSTLEDVFLHLCLGDESEREAEKSGMEGGDAPPPVQVNDMEEGKKDEDEDHREKKKDDKKTKIKRKKVSSSVSEEAETSSSSNKSAAAAVAVEKSATSTEVVVKKMTWKKKTTKKRCPTKTVSCCPTSFFSPNRLLALLFKNMIRLWRNIGFLIFTFLMPTIQICLFCLAIGRDPMGMTIAVYNEDVNVTEHHRCERHTLGCILSDETTPNFTESHRKNLSCRFLSYVSEDILAPVFFDDYDSAVASVKRGEHWGILHFRDNYTDSLYNRLFGLIQLQLPDNETMDRSDIHVNLDMTNQQVGYIIQLRLVEAYQRFSETLLSSCQLPPKLAALPIVFDQPIYGSAKPTFTEFMAPGIILSITYFMAVGLTALSYIMERKEGLLDRSWVAGVTATEVMLAHVMTQFVVMCVQVALILVFMINVFQVPAEGPIVWVVILTILQGICGMSFGLVISAVCDNENDAIQLALASFYPNLLLSGIIWPLEGMPEVLRYLSYVLPQTYACEAMRGILSRGWGLQYMQVYRGFLVTIAWTVGLLVLSAVLLKIKR